MELYNSTLESGFILVGILTDSGSPGLLCTTISVLYTLALTSNGLLFLVITMDARLHVRMYLLLSQLSLMDLMLTSVVIPKMLVDYLRGENAISFEGYALQRLSLFWNFNQRHQGEFGGHLPGQLCGLSRLRSCRAEG